MQPDIFFGELQQQDAKSARDFCLRVIKDVYGIDYQANWHADLDDLLNPLGIYSSKKDGIFYVAKIGGEIVGTIGIKMYQKNGYAKGKNVSSIWRTYVKKDLRNHGIGKKLVKMAESFINQLGYKKIYLHTSKKNPNAIVFWQKRGFKIILEENNSDKTVHMEKNLDS